MGFGDPEFIIWIVGISTLGWVITTSIRAKHGYPLEGEWGGTISKKDGETEKKTAVLVEENQALKGKVEMLEDRLKVLERIATDPSRQLADDIERLR